jgi:hypothetical protein
MNQPPDRASGARPAPFVAREGAPAYADPLDLSRIGPSQAPQAQEPGKAIFQLEVAPAPPSPPAPGSPAPAPAPALGPEPAFKPLEIGPLRPGLFERAQRILNDARSALVTGISTLAQVPVVDLDEAEREAQDAVWTAARSKAQNDHETRRRRLKGLEVRRAAEAANQGTGQLAADGSPALQPGAIVIDGIALQSVAAFRDVQLKSLKLTFEGIGAALPQWPLPHNASYAATLDMLARFREVGQLIRRERAEGLPYIGGPLGGAVPIVRLDAEHKSVAQSLAAFWPRAGQGTRDNRIQQRAVAMSQLMEGYVVERCTDLKSAIDDLLVLGRAALHDARLSRSPQRNEIRKRVEQLEDLASLSRPEFADVMAAYVLARDSSKP